MPLRVYADRACVHVAMKPVCSAWLLAALVLLGGCAGSARLDAPLTPLVPAATAPHTEAETEVRLRTSADRWMGVPYKWGGTSRNGIDCSAFVRAMFQETFSVPLPRSTHTQVRVGMEVPWGEFQTGDLIFFKTSRRTNHVGIYLRDGQFVHASSSRGVTISPLQGFYERKFWTARRILPRFGTPRPDMPAPLAPTVSPVPAQPTSPIARPGW
ncbi:MAG: NlpC/P60 family protein [Bacteroidota bacterium]